MIDSHDIIFEIKFVCPTLQQTRIGRTLHPAVETLASGLRFTVDSMSKETADGGVQVADRNGDEQHAVDVLQAQPISFQGIECWVSLHLHLQYAVTAA